MTVNQISVFLENRTGQLADITAVLSENQIDLRAISMAETASYGVLRLIVDDPQKASAVLLEKGFIITMTPVEAVLVPDRPGGLSELLAAVSRADIGLEYMYSVLDRGSNAYMILKTGDNAKLAEVLENNGFRTIADK